MIIYVKIGFNDYNSSWMNQIWLEFKTYVFKKKIVLQFGTLLQNDSAV